MTDVSDLRGVFPTSVRWNSELGTLAHYQYDPDTGERAPVEIELGSPAAKFAMDYGCRERGYGKVALGFCDMRLTAVGSPPPPWPGDEDYKPAVGMWLWNPPFGELRLETNGAILLRTISGLWERVRTFKEATAGLQPVIHFTGSRERPVRAVNKTLREPVVDIIGWMPREKVPPFALRQATVAPPVALDAQTPFSELQNRTHKKLDKPTVTKPAGSSDRELDDNLPF